MLTHSRIPSLSGLRNNVRPITMQRMAKVQGDSNSKGSVEQKAKNTHLLSDRLKEELAVLKSELDQKMKAESKPLTVQDVVDVKSEFSKLKIQTFKRKRKGRFFHNLSFEELDVRPELREALSSIEITHPSHIQGLAFDAFHEFGFQRNLLLADQAGSGKTLAYLGPLIEKLRFEEDQLGKRLTTPSQPRAIIMVPTTDLVVQVLDLCRKISKTCPFRSIAVTGGKRRATQVEALREGVDVVICTPSKLLSHLETKTMDLDNCSTVVLDEVDVLLGSFSDFSETTMKVLDFVSSGTQFMLVSATIPEEIYDSLTSLFPDLTLVLGTHLHCTSPRVTEQLIDCSGGIEINEESGQRRKMEALLSLLKTEKHDRTMIFCNKIETCRKVENFLKRADRKETQYKVFSYHSAITEPIKTQNLKTFLKDGQERPLILVSTDRASRGLDTYNVSHVILFDFPRDPTEYVRRVGRTARGDQQEGVVSVLVLGRQVSFAKSVLSRSKRAQPLIATPAIDKEEGRD